MTAPARITQADMERATKAVRSAGYANARIIMDFASRRIEVILGEVANESPPEPSWGDDDV